VSKKRWAQLNRDIVQCETCPRLRKHCKNVAKEKRQAYFDQPYWGKPVPNFGSAKADLLIVGLAPGAHGANRTGRMFTGDRSGEWLYRALHHAGFANQPESTGVKDGLKLINCTITNVCLCAPPGNKPNRDELLSCRPFFIQALELCRPQVILALGGLAWKETLAQLFEAGQMEPIRPKPKFSHGAKVKISEGRWLIGSYHVSQQNTFTGRLTEEMLDSVFDEAKRLIKQID
jgi:uracil-DNA glycosylase family 4